MPGQEGIDDCWGRRHQLVLAELRNSSGEDDGDRVPGLV